MSQPAVLETDSKRWEFYKDMNTKETLLFPGHLCARWLLKSHSTVSSFQLSKRMMVLITPTLKMRQPRLRDVKSPAQGYTAHTVRQRQSWDLNPGLSDA